LIEGGLPPPDYPEIGGLFQTSIRYIQPPFGPINVGPESTVESLAATAKKHGIETNRDVSGFLGAAKKRDRYDYACGCKLFYPGSAGAGG
jgi:hypothetical protein